MNFLCFFFLTVVIVDGTKRNRDELEDMDASTEIQNIIDVLLARSEGWFETLREMDPSPFVEILLSLKRLEVEAFQIILDNFELKRDAIVKIVNSKINPARTLTKRPLNRFHITVWKYGLMGSRIPQFIQSIKTDARILTSVDGIDYIELTDKMWESYVFPYLAAATKRDLPELRMHQLRKPISKSELDAFLPPIAREYVHQHMRKEPMENLTTFPIFLRMFPSKSLLLRRLVKYMISVRSMGIIDRAAALYLKSNPEEKDLAQVAIRINALFDSPPAMRVLYDAPRLKSLRQIGPLGTLYNCTSCDIVDENVIAFNHADMIRFVLDPFRIPDQPQQITPQDVIKEWLRLERSQVVVGARYGEADTTMNRMPFNIEFQLPVGRYQSRADILSAEAKLRILELSLTIRDDSSLTALTLSTLSSNLVTIQGVTNSTADDVMHFFAGIISARRLPLEIANELCRINKLQIPTNAVAVLRGRQAAGVDHLITPDMIVEFYKLMLQAIRTRPNKREPFTTNHYPTGTNFALLDYDLWKKHFVQPQIDALSSSH